MVNGSAYAPSGRPSVHPLFKWFSRVIVGQNCILLPDAAPNDFFLIYFIKDSVNMLWT